MQNLIFIIHSYSSLFIEACILNDIIIHKKKLTGKKLIGVVCGTVASFLIILAFVILIIQRRNKYKINEITTGDKI